MPVRAQNLRIDRIRLTLSGTHGTHFPFWDHFWEARFVDQKISNTSPPPTFSFLALFRSGDMRKTERNISICELSQASGIVVEIYQQAPGNCEILRPKINNYL